MFLFVEGSGGSVLDQCVLLLLRGQKEIYVQSGMMYFTNWGGDQCVCFC